MNKWATLLFPVPPQLFLTDGKWKTTEKKKKQKIWGHILSNNSSSSCFKNEQTKFVRTKQNTGSLFMLSLSSGCSLQSRCHTNNCPREITVILVERVDSSVRRHKQDQKLADDLLCYAREKVGVPKTYVWELCIKLSRPKKFSKNCIRSFQNQTI